MTRQTFPELQPDAIRATRDALHGYALAMGDFISTFRPRRKHWWQNSLRPCLDGLTTGPVYAQIDFELELNLRHSELRVRVDNGAQLYEPLRGQPAREMTIRIAHFLSENGLTRPPNLGDAAKRIESTTEYSASVANDLASTWRAVSAALETFRAGIPEETSPIQLWPHHFDLAMMWLPGETINGKDPANEETADKQMSFGFTLGDGTIGEPYFYITAYPQPAAFEKLKLPAGTIWHTAGFSGAVVKYGSLIMEADPEAYLVDLWNDLLRAGRQYAEQESLRKSAMNNNERKLDWHRVADIDELPEGRVKTVTAGTLSMALTHIDGQFTAMDNKCPHQGGPLGEGSIEIGGDGQCWLRCPWHGWDFDPKTGLPPGGHEDTGQTLYPVEVRSDGIYVASKPKHRMQPLLPMSWQRR